MCFPLVSLAFACVVACVCLRLCLLMLSFAYACVFACACLCFLSAFSLAVAFGSAARMFSLAVCLCFRLPAISLARAFSLTFCLLFPFFC